MSKESITFNSTNKVLNTNQFIINLPTNVNFGKNDRVGLESLSIYNSFYNISSSLQNNTFTIYWNADTITQYTYVIPDSNRSIDQINYYFQFCMIQDNLYCIDADGEIKYFIELKTESVLYAASITTFVLPTQTIATQLGYSKPTNATWNFPAVTSTPQIQVNKLDKLLGFNQSLIYPSTVQTTTQTFISSSTPQMSPVNSIIMSCNLLNSRMSIPSNIISSIPLKNDYGSMIDYNFSNPSLYNISSGNYHNIIVEFYDQYYNKLEIRDNDCIIRLLIEINEKKI